MEELISNDPTCGTAGLSFVRGDAETPGESDRIDEYFMEDTFRARFSLHDDVGFGSGLMIPGTMAAAIWWWTVSFPKPAVWATSKPFVTRPPSKLATVSGGMTIATECKTLASHPSRR
jgi:hypothetical protein